MSTAGKVSLLALVLLGSASAGASEDLLCTRSDGSVGAPSYLLVIKDSNPTDAAAIILERNFSVFRSAWSVDYSDAKAVRAADGGPLGVTGTVDPSTIDWNLPETRNECFIRYNTLRFRLNESTRGTTGSLRIEHAAARNPNLPNCAPLTAISAPEEFPVSCSDY